jgi:hypothetical protein
VAQGAEPKRSPMETREQKLESALRALLDACDRNDYYTPKMRAARRQADDALEFEPGQESSEQPE